MPVTFSLQALFDAQNTALTTTINAARDNVKADNTTQITNQNTSLTTAINAARDNVKADNVTQVTAQTTAINGNTDTKTAAVTTAVNGKGNIKSIQRGTVNPYQSSQLASVVVAISAVDIGKAVVIVNAHHQQAGNMTGGGNVGARLTSSTTLEVLAQTTSYGSTVYWQVVEYF